MTFGFVILYVENPAVSTAFYADLLGRPPVETSPTFAMFPLDNGAMLGLWSRNAVAPATGTTGGGTEIAFAVGDAAALQALHQDWVGRGLTIAQEPTRMGFGDTFVALDPDGHRLRVLIGQKP